VLNSESDSLVRIELFDFLSDIFWVPPLLMLLRVDFFPSLVAYEFDFALFLLALPDECPERCDESALESLSIVSVS
jgi:hypothetical protein